MCSIPQDVQMVHISSCCIMSESRRISITLRQDHECILWPVARECKLPMMLLSDGCGKEGIARSITACHVSKPVFISNQGHTSGTAAAVEAMTWLGWYCEMGLGRDSTYYQPHPQTPLPNRGAMIVLWVPRYQHQFKLFLKVFKIPWHSLFSNIQLPE